MFVFGLRVINQLIIGTFKKLPIKSPYRVAWRCWPIDIDTYMHMNNSCYARNAELARWRAFPQADMIRLLSSGVYFFAVDQSIQYFRPINAFQKFAIDTTVSITDNKWMHYHHTFVQHPDDLKSPDQKPTVFCIVKCKAVLKEKSGKTIPPAEVMSKSPLYKALMDDQNTEIHIANREKEAAELVAAAAAAENAGSKSSD